jgi:hypothetical protein
MATRTLPSFCHRSLPVGADNSVTSRDPRILVDQAAEVVVIDVFAEGVEEMSWAGDEDAIGALAPGAGDPAPGASGSRAVPGQAS